ncbi:Mettl5, partial [Symbiodinium sp. KB8]
MHDDIAGRTVADLGCGTGMLTAGALLLGAQHITALDVDPDAIAQAQDNLSSLGAEEGEDVTFQLADLGASDGGPADGPCPVPLVDTVIMNPPFGTRVEGIDVHFLTLAVRRARRAVYSMHKSSTRAHILKVASQLGAPATTLATMRFPIPRMYAHHTQDSVDVEVDLVRLDTSGVDHTGSVSEGVGSATPPTAAAAAAA